jgi:2-methylisocitrate lyase-like PEP mutase family enzyme
VSTSHEMEALVAQAERLRSLHHADRPLVLPNAWDTGSAIAVERAGAQAVATTSSGVSEALGYEDGERIPPAEVFLMVLRIAGAVRVPVTADLEAGYGLPADILVERLLQAGAVGLNLEDTDRSGPEPRLRSLALQADRIAAVRAAAVRLRVPIVINARIDVFLRGDGDLKAQVRTAIERANAYLAAGADCVYPIGLVDAGSIGRLVQRVDGPVNVLLRQGAPSLRRLRNMGVRRVSVGGGLWRQAMDGTEDLARRLMAGDGTAFTDAPEPRGFRTGAKR